MDLAKLTCRKHDGRAQIAVCTAVRRVRRWPAAGHLLWYVGFIAMRGLRQAARTLESLLTFRRSRLHLCGRRNRSICRHPDHHRGGFGGDYRGGRGHHVAQQAGERVGRGEDKGEECRREAGRRCLRREGGRQSPVVTACTVPSSASSSGRASNCCDQSQASHTSMHTAGPFVQTRRRVTRTAHLASTPSRPDAWRPAHPDCASCLIASRSTLYSTARPS